MELSVEVQEGDVVLHRVIPSGTGLGQWFQAISCGFRPSAWLLDSVDLVNATVEETHAQNILTCSLAMSVISFSRSRFSGSIIVVNRVWRCASNIFHASSFEV